MSFLINYMKSANSLGTKTEQVNDKERKWHADFMDEHKPEMGNGILAQETLHTAFSTPTKWL